MGYRLAYALTKLREQVNAAAPNRSKKSDGWVGDAAHFAQGSASDHNPWVTWNGEGIVTAIDITHDPANGCDVWKIAQAISASRDPRLKYLIYTGHEGGKPGILSSVVSPWTWRARRNDDHPHHLHVSVKSDKGSYDSTAPWAINPRSAPASAIPNLTDQENDLTPDQDKVLRETLRVVNALYKAEADRYPHLVGLIKGVEGNDAKAIAAAIPASIAQQVIDALKARL